MLKRSSSTVSLAACRSRPLSSFAESDVTPERAAAASKRVDVSTDAWVNVRPNSSTIRSTIGPTIVRNRTVRGRGAHRTARSRQRNSA